MSSFDDEATTRRCGRRRAICSSRVGCGCRRRRQIIRQNAFASCRCEQKVRHLSGITGGRWDCAAGTCMLAASMAAARPSEAGSMLVA